MTTTLFRADLAVRHAISRAVRGFRDEKGEVNIVATVLLIVVAVALIVLFQDKLGEWIEKMFSAISSDVDSVSGGE